MRSICKATATALHPSQSATATAILAAATSRPRRCRTWSLTAAANRLLFVAATARWTDVSVGDADEGADDVRGTRVGVPLADALPLRTPGRGVGGGVGVETLGGDGGGDSDGDGCGGRDGDGDDPDEAHVGVAASATVSAETAQTAATRAATSQGRLTPSPGAAGHSPAEVDSAS